MSTPLLLILKLKIIQIIYKWDGDTMVLTLKVNPAAQLGTGAYAVVVGSNMDVSAYKTVAYTIKVADFSVYWKVFGANNSDFSDEVEVKSEASVAAAGVDSYAVSIAPYSYYRVKIKNNAGAGTATVSGVSKR